MFSHTQKQQVLPLAATEEGVAGERMQGKYKWVGWGLCRDTHSISLIGYNRIPQHHIPKCKIVKNKMED